MRLENIVDTEQHFIDIPDNSLGIKRKAFVDNFSFSPRNKRFSLVVRVEHFDNNGDKINAISIIDIYDEFIGDLQIMVYFNPENPSDPRNGQILNPDRGEVEEDVPYISQYEFIYLAFTNPVICLDMIKGLLLNYDHWIE